MSRMLLLPLAAVLLLSKAAPADDKPKGAGGAEAVAAELQAAKDVYRTAVDQADETLLEGFDKQLERLKSSTKLKVDDQLKKIDDLQAERKIFEAKKYILPSSLNMRDTVSTYRLTTGPALTRCEKAFNTAAEKYRAMKDLTAAKAVLDQKQEFVLANTPFNFEGIWYCKQASGWSGRRIVKGDVVTDPDGKSQYKWERSGGKIIVIWSEDNRTAMEIDFKKPNQFGTQAAGWTRVK